MEKYLLCCIIIYMDESEKPVIAQIKQARLDGLRDDEIEQQLMLGTWSPQDLQYGRNFLNLTKRSTLKDAFEHDELKSIERKEHLLHKGRSLLHFVTHWMLPLGAILGFAALTYVLLDRYVISSLSVDSTQVTAVVVPKNTTASSSVEANTSPAPDPTTANRARVKLPGGGVMCTPDQKVCPNGENAKRVPPMCDFAPCSEVAR